MDSLLAMPDYKLLMKSLLMLCVVDLGGVFEIVFSLCSLCSMFFLTKLLLVYNVLIVYLSVSSVVILLCL